MNVFSLLRADLLNIKRKKTTISSERLQSLKFVKSHITTTLFFFIILLLSYVHIA